MEISDYNNASTTPDLADNSIAVRVASFVSFLAGLFFLLSPITFGRWMDAGALNCRFIGAIVVSLAGTRLLRPLSYRGFSFANSFFGVWIGLSPWIFGYAEHGDRIVNSVALGFALLVSSLLSARIPTMRGTSLAKNS